MVIGLLSCLIAAQGTFADQSRFRVDGNRLFYNSSIPSSEIKEDDIAYEDAEELALILMDEPQVDTVVLESEGGNSWAALRMAEAIQRFGLQTEVRNGCYSACPLIFLAGEPRILAKGGVLGFHRSSADVNRVAAFMKLADETSPSEFMYDEAISKAVERYSFMRQQGVDADFILQVMATPAREMWYPTREELISAGIIDE